MWCECEISFQFERIFHSPQMDSFLLTTQFVHCLISSSWWWENSSHFGLQDEQGKTGQARPGNFDPSWNRSTQFQVRARLTWRPPIWLVSNRDGCCWQVDPARFDPPLFSVSTIVSSARIISVTATLTNSLVCLDGALLVLSGVHFGLSASIKWKCGADAVRLRIRTI